MSSEAQKSIETAAGVILELEENNETENKIEGVSKKQETSNSAGHLTSPTVKEQSMVVNSSPPATTDDSTVPEEPSPPPPASKKPLVSHVLVQLEQLIVSDEWTQQNKVHQAGPKRKFPNCSAHFHDDPLRGGIVYVTKLALRSLYPKLAHSGYQCFAEKRPVVYVSPALHYDVSQYLAVELGLPDVVTVSKIKSSVSDIEGRLDHTELEQRLVSDSQEGKRPVLVVAVVGSAIFGQNDLVSKLLELREQHNFWLHVVGQGTAALALKEPPEHLVKVLQSVNSFTILLGQWLAVSAVPAITLYRPVEEVRAVYREKLDSLPWWVVTQHLTPNRMSDCIEFAYRLSRALLKGLLKFPQIEVLGMTSPNEYRERMETGKLLPPTVIVFKYNSAVSSSATKNEESSKNDDSDAELAEQEYKDCLNAWVDPKVHFFKLGQGLIGECPFMGFHLVELGGEHGTAIRYCALESAALYNTEPDHIQTFMKQLEDTLSIIDATVEARSRLPELLQQYPALKEIPVQKWAGVGAVSYVPTIVRETPREKWNEKQKQQVSHLNIELVHSLRCSDSAFSIGGSEEHVACVKFGMLADERDLADLISMVAERGKQIEESSQYLESLAEMVRQGIEAANEDLKKENQERLMQEGVLRQVPLVGSFLNWWSPLSQDSVNIRGRAFDLKTDVIYRHKLQIKMNGETGEENPLVPMTPITTPQVPHGVASEESAVEAVVEPTEEGQEINTVAQQEEEEK